MKLRLIALVLVASAVALPHSAQADFIFGTQAYQSTATTSSPDSNDVNDTSFTLSFATLLGGSNQTGDYIGTFGTFVNSLDTTTLLGFVFGSAVYGTFTPDAVLENSLISNTSRTIQLSGTFAPSAATFGPGFDPTPGILTITINEASVAGVSVLSASATLATAPNRVPEPSTIAMIVSAIGPLGMVLYRRRQRA